MSHLKYIYAILFQILALGLSAQQPDSVNNLHLYRPDMDSVSAREAFVRDSILARERFVHDSILARELFVKDSLLRKQKVLDSLHILKTQLPRLLEAYNKTVRDEIILKCGDIPLIGDSVLGDFVLNTLPFGVKDPYCPWKITTALSGGALRIIRDKNTNQITGIHTSQFKASFSGGLPGKPLIIQRPAIIQKNSRGSFYRIPIDSVFYDRSGRIAKIRSCEQFYNLINENQKGQLLFTNSNQVKQYTYDQSGILSTMQLVRFCERWKAYETNKVCSIINYSFSRNGNKIILLRKNDPVNNYSDGTYTFLLRDNDEPAAISFTNSANTEGWERTIEMNKDGYVSCYIDKSKGLIFQSLCMIYHPEPGARYPVETITTTFEKDGISYLQKNNTTGKIRTRDRMTLEWSAWK